MSPNGERAGRRRGNSVIMSEEEPRSADDQGDNPFSFKSFLSRRAGEGEEERGGGGAEGGGAKRPGGRGKGGAAAKEKRSASESLPFPDLAEQGNAGGLHVGV